MQTISIMSILKRKNKEKIRYNSRTPYKMHTKQAANQPRCNYNDSKVNRFAMNHAQ